MNQLVMVFIIGLTAGGLGCVAVQGGLLALCLAPRTSPPATAPLRTKHGSEVPTTDPRLAATPILLFLLAKLVAHTLLGWALGALGSLLQLTALTRALLLIAIGIFMVGNGLRMLDVHPIFRHFVLEPPAAVRRYVRRRAKKGADAITPLMLGGLTVLIPCGVTQAMMALAIATGDALLAAGLMGAFTLGSSVVFFTVAYLATRLGAVLEENLARAVAIVLLALGLVSVDSGLNLAGAPISATRLIQAASAPAVRLSPSAPPAVTSMNPASGENVLDVRVSSSGYTPAQLHARAGVPTRLTLVTENVYSCALALVIPELGVEQMLPLTGEATIDIPPQPAGKVLRYSCAMGCNTAQIVFDQ